MPPPEEAKNRLLVEGKDDQAVAIHLTRRHGVDWDAGDPSLPHVYLCEGIDSLLDQIDTAVITYERLGILVDADLDVPNRWQQVKARLEGAAVVLPDHPEAKGTIVSGARNGCQVGVWMMPDNTSPGNLESFLATLVPHGDACWPYAEEATSRAKGLGAPFSGVDRLKARVHTWLAWQEEPGRPFGTALTACYFDHDSEEALGFVSWFQRLFLD